MAASLTQSCPGCGAQLSYAANQAVLRCGYCGTEVAVDRPETIIPRAMDADYVVPAAYSIYDVRTYTLERMAGGKHTPDDIIDNSEIIETKIFYVPAHYFTGSYHADWTASFGYDRQEAYTAYRTVDGRQEAYTAYRTVTDWRPASGSDSGGFEVMVYGGEDRTSGVADVAGRSFNETMTDFNAQVLTGFDVEEFRYTAADVYDWRGSDQVDDIIESGVKSHAQGDHQRGWRWTSTIQRTDETAIVPVAKSVFRYNDTNYTTWFNGVYKLHQVGDALPVDSARKRAIALGFIPLWVALGLWVVGFPALQSNFLLGAALTLTAMVFGFVRRGTIIGHSKSVRQDSLLRHTAEQSTNNDLTPEQAARLEQTYQKRAVPGLARIDKDRVVLPVVTVSFALALAIAGFATSENPALTSPDLWVSSGGTTEASIEVPNGTQQDSAQQTTTVIEAAQIGPAAMSALEIRDSLMKDGFCNFVSTDTYLNPDQYANCYMYENPSDPATCMYNVAIIQDRYGDGAVSSTRAADAQNRMPLAPVSYADGFWEVSVYGVWDESIRSSLMDSLTVYLDSTPVATGDLVPFEDCAWQASGEDSN